MRTLLLDFPGTITALAIGALVLIASRAYAMQSFVLLLAFLIISVAATKYKYAEKRVKGLYEHERGWQNVLSNGSIPALCTVGYALTGTQAWIAAFICSLAAATADKFGSELGVLSGRPVSLRNFHRVRPGVSGAISPLGTLMSFIGALIISTFGYFLYSFDPFLMFSIAAIGFAGAFADTLAGIPEEAGIGNKSTSNAICTLVGAALGYALIAL